jgi:hypothetical protein
MKPEANMELGKDCLTITTGVFFVGIIQPILSGHTEIQRENLSIMLVLFFGCAGVILLNKGGPKEE